MGTKRQPLVSKSVRYSRSGLNVSSDEHQRRSPDCSFFTLYASIKAKPARSRKGRASKASRMSTQSNATAVSEGLSAVDTEANPDETVLSTTDLARPNKTARGVKKAPKTKKSTAKAKRKGAKAKQEGSQLASSFVEPEDDDFEVKVQPSPVPAGSSKKRKSEDISEANDKDMRAEPQLPPKKRRTTRASSIAVQSQEVPIAVPQEHNEQETPMSDVEETQPSLAPAPKRGKASKKRSSTRKASTASTASKASLRAAVPNDEEIDAALEAELDRPLTDDEGKGETLEIDEPRTRRLTRNKPGSKKAAASVASTRRGTRATSVAVDEASVLNGYPDISNIEDEQRSPVNVIEEVPTQKASKTSKAKNSKAKASRNVSSQQQTQGKLSENTKDSGPGHDEEDAQGHNPTVEPQQPETRVDFPELSARKTRASQVSNGDTNSPNTRSSVVNTQPTRDDSGHESDTSVISQSRTKHAGKKPSAAVKKIKRGMKPPSIVSHVEEAAQGSADARPIETQNEMTPVAGDDTNHAEPDVMTGKVPEEESKALKASKPSKAKGRPAKAKAVARKAPAVSSPTQPEIVVQTPVEPALPQPQSAHSTPRPALSPQSSDAENQPPSSRPEAIRPPLSMQLPSKNQTIKVPLAATTPDSSPIRGNSSKLQSSFPWTAVDLEQIFHGTPSAGKENDPFFFGGTTNQEILPSPEKKLNVEEWIKFNAQRGEEKLRNECERLVGRFEGEGVRALRTLEGIACVQ